MTKLNRIDRYLSREGWEIRENSNMGYSLQGLNVSITENEISKYWLNEVYPKDIKEAHESGDFHIHDLGTLGSYCVGWDLMDLLTKGFKGVRGKIESLPAKHLRVAMLQIVNFMYTLQGETAGAQAFSNVDTFLAAFIRSDNVSYEDLKQNVQEFIFNLNVPTRVGAQAPFTNFTLDLVVPDHLKKLPAIVGGKPCDFTYGELQHEVDMFNRAFAEIMIEGDAGERPFTFPIPTYNLTEDFDWENPIYNPIWEMTAKYGTPYFSNFINSDMNPEDVRSMAILGSQNVIYKNGNGRVSIDEIRNIVSRWISSKEKPSYSILNNGKFVSISDMFEVPYDKYDKYVSIMLDNGLKQNFSMQHKCPVVRDGEITNVESQDLIAGDMLLFAKRAYDIDEAIGSYEAGLMVGYFLGEGWKQTHSDSEINFAINIEREDIVKRIYDFFTAIGCEVSYYKQEDVHIFKVHVYGRQAVGFVSQYIRGTTAKTKRIDYKTWNTSLLFREGMFEGYQDTDGSKKVRNIAHTTNKKLVEDLVVLCSSIGRGVSYSVNKNNTRYFKKDKSDFERFTSYKLEERDYNDFNDDYYTVDVKSVSFENSKSDVVYNFTVSTKEHLYELPNGIVTHQCCRLRINNGDLYKRGGGLFGANPKTGSLGVVTINLPRIGCIADNEEEFLDILTGLMWKAKDSLEIKRELLEKLTEQGLYPYSEFYLRDISVSGKGYWHNHFSTIGTIGMNDALYNLLDTDIMSEEGKEFAIRVLSHMREVISLFQNNTGNIYNLEATPAESASFKLALKDLKYLDDIKFYNIDVVGGDTPYYTNSSQLPASSGLNLFDSLDLQDELQVLYTGGTVFHTFLGERAPDIGSLKALIKKIATNYHLPYFFITPTFSVCPNHGYVAGEHLFCPECEERCEIYSRVVGYIRPLDAFNDAKVAEFFQRDNYTVSGDVPEDDLTNTKE